MARDLPNTTSRFIQIEETSGLNTFSESVAQALGGDLNYINAQIIAVAAQIAAYNAGGALTFEVFSIGSAGTSVVTPNGKNIVFAIVVPIVSNAIVAEWRAVIPGVTTYFPNAGGTGNPNPPNISAVIVGNALDVTSYHEWTGVLVYPP